MTDSNCWTFNDFKQATSVLDEMCEVKDYSYGRSFSKRGLIRGCMANIDRKYDRLDAAIKLLEEMPKAEGEDDSGFFAEMLESLADLRNYCQLTIMDIKEKHSKAFDLWKVRTLDEIKRLRHANGA